MNETKDIGLKFYKDSKSEKYNKNILAIIIN